MYTILYAHSCVFVLDHAFLLVTHTCTDVAKEVLNHCMETNASVEGPIHPWSKEYTVTFNYEFLEDHRDSNHNWSVLAN